jgi:murein DD-endopeptidase MepM/ murein hydrolase activator NlpD
MPHGAEIVAARGGLVVEVRDHYSDSEHRVGYENLVAIQHDDGTVAVYTHLKYLGALVTLGELVSIGQSIGLAGATEDTDAVDHVHFEVFGGPPAHADETVPVSFRNAEGPLDPRGGQIAEETYVARPCG